MRLAIFVLACLLSTRSWAGAEPTTRIEADGTVVGEIVVDQSQAEVLGYLSDPGHTERLSDDVVAFTVTPRGKCSDVSRTVKGAWNPLRLIVRRCRTEKGFSERLVSSDDFTRADGEWRVEASAEGTRLSYRVRTEVNLPVPRAMVRKRTESSIRRLLKKLGSVLSR